MKKLIWTFAIFISVSLTSCSGSIEDAIADAEQMAEDAKSDPTVVGFWELSEFDMGIEIPAEQQAMFDNLKKEMIENSNVSFKEDGTYAQNDYMDGKMVSQSGTYVVDGDKLTMTTGDDESTITISTLTATEMAFQSEEDGTTMTLTYKRP